MALTYGQKWTFYLLMATHPTTANNDGKSQFRVDVEADALASHSTDLANSMVKIGNNRFGLSLSNGDIGPLPPGGFSAVQLRAALGFSANEYDPTMGPCPDSTTDAQGVKQDHQLAIARAILALTGPV